MVAPAIDPFFQFLESFFSVEELATECLFQANGDGGTEGFFGGFLLFQEPQSFPDDFAFRGVAARGNSRRNEVFEIGGE